MKHFRFLSPIVVAVSITALLFSCNNGSEKADEPSGDSSGVKSTESTTPVKPDNLMVIIAKIANYDKWLPDYESHDSIRNANGLHNFVVARGTKDPNMVMVALRMDDADKAKAFASSPDLKARMQKSGVTGPPTISYLDVQMADTTANTTSTRLMVTHKIKDWDAWKKVFDEDKPNRMNAGLTDRLLAYNIGDNKMVTLVFLVSDMKKAEDFSKSPELKAKMEKGGVDGPPSFFYFNVVKKY